MTDKNKTEHFPLPVPEMPERFLMDLHGKCNLCCPMCLVHGLENEQLKQEAIGTMVFDEAIKILDQIKDAKPLVAPSLWGEPLIMPRLKEYIREMKQRGLAVAINTNGLTLKKHHAEFFVEVELDSVSVSIDATTTETQKKVRTVDKLDKIHRNIDMMLEVRGNSTLPRVGVSYTIQPENEHEVDEFVDHWIKKVDVVRVGGVFSDGRLYGLKLPEKRVPCKKLYQTMPIHYNGDALICCLDGLAKNVMGNVFRDGVRAVWHGEGYSKVRHYHETEQWDKVPFCKNCNAWVGEIYEEEIHGGILIRRSPQFVYYNRIDRLRSWTSNIRGHVLPAMGKAM